MSYCQFAARRDVRPKRINGRMQRRGPVRAFSRTHTKLDAYRVLMGRTHERCNVQFWRGFEDRLWAVPDTVEMEA
jgi:hypothetical protein